MDQRRLEHVKMIQRTIERMAQNSFLLRGWSVTLATGILAIAVAEEKHIFTLLALMPALALWGLDAFYLRQERLFRGLHDEVCAAFGNQGPVSFSMDTRHVTGVHSWFKTLFAKVVVGLHGPLILVILAVGLLIHREGLAALVACIAAALGP
jgi:hypothetical protein